MDWETGAASSAAAFGVTVADYKKAVFDQTFGLTPQPIPPQPAQARYPQVTPQ
jgi:hypothetical protein